MAEAGADGEGGSRAANDPKVSCCETRSAGGNAKGRESTRRGELVGELSLT